MLRYLLPVVLAVLASVPSPATDPAKDHWAFKTPVRPAVPETQNAIDHFILAKLAKEELKPSPEADKVTLCRRVYLDLIGLPPTPKEVDDFVADKAADAYEKLVEKLLESPHHGERWARWWLDAARYADSDGYEKDKSRQVWAYRDWVINALNADMPYDRFVTEQVAGDLLPNAKQEQIVATGFLRMSMLNEEGGIDPEQFRMDAMFDRMDAVGRAFLGLSVACSQCHDHKFDPLTQEDYFRLFAFLNNDHEAQRVVYTPAEQMQVNGIRETVRGIEAKLKEANPDWAKLMAAWEVAQKRPEWKTVAVENAGDNSQRYLPQKDGSILAQGYAPTKFSTLMRGPAPVKTITGFRIELLNDPNLPCNGPGRSILGTSALTEFMVEVESAKEPGKRAKVKFAAAHADFEQPEKELEKWYDDKSGKKRVTGSASYAIDGNDLTAWGIDAGPGRRNVPRVAVFVPEQPLELPDGATLHFNLKQSHGGWNSDDNMNHNLGRFRLSVTGDEAKGAPLPPLVARTLAIPAGQRTPAQADTVFGYWRTTVKEFEKENAAIEAERKKWPEGSTSLVSQKRDDPRETSILKRGNFLRPGEKVAAGTPAFLHPPPDKADDSRLTLAKWLTDKKSPTTARAVVNRVWLSYFGTGLVDTPEEFGTQGAKPSHPELLDWLAVEFMEPTKPSTPVAKGVLAPWSLKYLHRLIVTSATYKQSARVTPELLAQDPNNRLLARGPRFRADGEIVRDIALSASGLLNPKIGGPSVFTPAPLFLFTPPASYGPFEWVEAKGEDRYRRAMYTFRRRSTPYPALTVFDVPVGETSCVKRTRTNTALQALTGLNETIFVECARALGKRAILEGGKTDAERLTHAFRLCVARKPTADELELLTGLLDKFKARYAARPAGLVVPGTTEPVRAAEVATGMVEPKEKLPPGLTYPEWAAYTLVARVILNLDETVTKE